MGASQDFFQQLTHLFNVITDWLIIVIGLALGVKAFVAIDVPIAKYTVIGAGILLIALGFWYRYRRKRRHREERTEK